MLKPVSSQPVQKQTERADSSNTQRHLTDLSVSGKTGLTYQEIAALAEGGVCCDDLTVRQRAVKRTFDILLTSILFILLSPPMILIMVIIRIDSPGPVLFRQMRVGEGGRLFKMYKFRTMVWDAENSINYTSNYKQPDDPRVTTVGKWLRRLSLDELPQFINVLKGDLSLVGPRPELPQVVALYSSWQRKRFDVPQGITGWWQINGRADLPMYENVGYDIFYIRNYSVWLDLQIIARTPLAVLQGRGAF